MQNRVKPTHFRELGDEAGLDRGKEQGLGKGNRKKRWKGLFKRTAKRVEV
jgi:hypothetical protein